MRQALLPLILHAIAQTSIFGSDVARGTDSSTGSDKPQPAPTYGSSTPLLILTASAVAAVHTSSGSNAVLSIGLSYAVLVAIALRLLESAHHVAENPAPNGSVIYSANGFLAQPNTPAGTASDTTTIRDVSIAAALGTSLAALTLETFGFGGLTYEYVGYQGTFGQAVWDAVYGLGTVVVHIVMLGPLLVMVSLTFAMSTKPLGICPSDLLHASRVSAISATRIPDLLSVAFATRRHLGSASRD